jgi:hypothetical protein
MERKKIIETENQYRRGLQVEGLAKHPFAVTQSELDANSQMSFPWDLHKRQQQRKPTL